MGLPDKLMDTIVSKGEDKPSEEEVVDESSVEDLGDMISSADDLETTLDYKALAEEMKTIGEGALRDKLYRDGYDMSNVEDIIIEIKRIMKGDANLDVKGMYASGGAKKIIDGVEIDGDFSDAIPAEEKAAKPKKKKEEVAEDPVVEIYKILTTERVNLPVVYVKKILISEENWKRLMEKAGVSATKFQVVYKAD